MKVILKEYVYKHGVAGDVVNVADGFARNYLIPRGLATKASPGALRENQHLIEQAAKNREHLRQMESEVAIKIDGVELVFGVKAGKNNKLYGSITTRDISEKLLEKTGVDVNRRRISERPLRELGMHEIPVHMGQHVSPVLRVAVIRDEEVADYLAGKPVSSMVTRAKVEYVEVDEQPAADEAEAAVPDAEAAAEA
jgi:large subunit ribosomal protein L9